MMSGKEKTNKQQKTTKRQKGLEYDSLNDSKRKKKTQKSPYLKHLFLQLLQRI